MGNRILLNVIQIISVKVNKIMSKNSLEKLLKADSHYEGDLVSLDFKSESLNKFLQNVVNLVNQHSQRLNQLEMEKMNIDRVRNGNEKIVYAQKLPQNIIATLPNVYASNKVDTYEDTVDGICANMKLCVHSLQYVYGGLKKKDQEVRSINDVLDQFEKADNASETVRKAIQTCKKHTDDEMNKILTRFKELQMKTNKKIAEFENVTKETEKKTLWKISECESSLLKKITPEYVEKAIEQLEVKIHNDIKNKKNQQLNEIKFNFQNVKSKVDALMRDFQESERENKTLLKELQENGKTYEKREKSEADKRQVDVRIKELLLKIDRLEKREDPESVELRLRKITTEHQQKIVTHNEKIQKLEHELESINNVMSSISGNEGGMDPHKLCHIDGEVRRLRDSNRTNESKLQSLEDEVKTKLLVFEERIMTTLGMLKSQDNFVSREEMYESLSRLREPVTERMNENQNLIHQLHGKITKLELFEKATKRKIKQLTRGDELNKILDMKMGIQQAQTQFGSINMKVENLQIILNRLKMDVDGTSEFMNYLKKEMNQPEEGINILGPKQKVFPAKCLGCGFKHNPVHENNMMMGSDGKYYRVDLRTSFTGEQKEVYGVTPSQLAVYENSIKKSRQTGRPTSSKTNIRPNSASRF